MANDLHTSDPKIIQNITRRISGGGIRAPSRVTVNVAKGEVTLSGTLQYEHQRQVAVRAANGEPGVRRVIDNLRTTPPVRRT
jgi:osmotically-inducible protein OsmY